MSECGPSRGLWACDRHHVAGPNGVTPRDVMSLSPRGCSHLAKRRGPVLLTFPDLSLRLRMEVAPVCPVRSWPSARKVDIPGRWRVEAVTPAPRDPLRGPSRGGGGFADAPCCSPPPRPPSLRPPSLCSLCCHDVTIPAQGQALRHPRVTSHRPILPCLK